MNTQAPILLALHRIGPYHHARFNAAARHLQQPLIVLETRPDSQEYPWEFQPDQSLYTALQLAGALEAEDDLPSPELMNQLNILLAKYQPALLVTVGWADRAYLILLWLGQKHGIPVIVISDSRASDSFRSPLIEFLKRNLLRGYSAALAAGFESKKYLASLGLTDNSIFQPWDVVDNQFFERIAGKVSFLGSESKSFLCVGRFIPEKNHEVLLSAYRHYQLNGGKRSLHLVGHGPLKHEIERLIDDLPMPERVLVSPFQQINQLANYYAEAHAVILPSRKDTWGLVVNEAMAAGVPVIVSDACGCNKDLISHGETGWSFSYNNSSELATCLQQVDTQGPHERMKIIKSAKDRVSLFGVEDFAVGLKKACSYANSNQISSKRSKILAYLLQKMS